MTKITDRLKTFQESGVTILPYETLPAKYVRKCIEHEYEKRTDGKNMWFQCKNCGVCMS